MNLRLYLFTAMLAGMLFPASRLAAQADSLKPLNNIVEVFNCRNNSLNGISPNITPNYRSRMLRGGWGISYVRLIGQREIALEASVNQWSWRGSAFSSPTQFDPVGFVDGILSTYFSARMHYPFLDKDRIKWFGSLGATFRTGYESLIVKQGSLVGGLGDQIAIGQPQRDLGPSIGSRLSWYPHRRIVLSADVRYTRFFYRFTTFSEDVPAYKGTSQNLASIQAKLGFCF